VSVLLALACSARFADIASKIAAFEICSSLGSGGTSIGGDYGRIKYGVLALLQAGSLLALILYPEYSRWARIVFVAVSLIGIGSSLSALLIVAAVTRIMEYNRKVERFNEGESGLHYSLSGFPYAHSHMSLLLSQPVFSDAAFHWGIIPVVAMPISFFLVLHVCEIVVARVVLVVLLGILYAAVLHADYLSLSKAGHAVVLAVLCPLALAIIVPCSSLAAEITAGVARVLIYAISTYTKLAD